MVKSMLKGSISRIGRYAIASSITDQCITCTTFNILAPIYKRLSDDEVCLHFDHFNDYKMLLIEGSYMLCWDFLYAISDHVFLYFWEATG